MPQLPAPMKTTTFQPHGDQKEPPAKIPPLVSGVGPAQHVFAFSLKQKVKIKELDRPGVVLAIHIGDAGTTYSVRYFWNGDPKDTYFHEWELE